MYLLCDTLSIETISPESTFCDTAVQVPSSAGDMELN